MKIIRPSEARKWQYFISWDNPQRGNYNAMRKALAILGATTQLHTKTSVALSPHSSTKPRHVREMIKRRLDLKKGNAFYVNLRSGKGFQIGSKTRYLWKHIP